MRKKIIWLEFGLKIIRPVCTTCSVNQILIIVFKIINSLSLQFLKSSHFLASFERQFCCPINIIAFSFKICNFSNLKFKIYYLGQFNKRQFEKNIYKWILKFNLPVMPWMLCHEVSLLFWYLFVIFWPNADFLLKTVLIQAFGGFHLLTAFPFHFLFHLHFNLYSDICNLKNNWNYWQ